MDATTRQCANRRTPTLKALLILFLCAGLVGAWVSVFPTWALADEPTEEIAAPEEATESEDATVEDETETTVAAEPDEPVLTAQDDGPTQEGENEGEDPFVRDGIANIDELPEDIFTDGGSNSTVSMVLDFAALGVPDGVTPNIEIEHGPFSWDTEPPFGEPVVLPDFASYDPETKTVTLDGTKLLDENDEPLLRGIYVNAIVTWGEGDNQTTKIAGALFGVNKGNEYGARVWLTQDENIDRIYSGQSLTFHVGAENIPEGHALFVYVGHWFGRPDLSEAFAPGEGYAYDSATGTITLDGDQLVARDLDHVDVFALIAPQPADGQVVAWDDKIEFDVRNIEVREPYEGYADSYVRDDSMIRGWEWEVRRWYDFYLDTPEHPDNEPNHPGRYEVTDVQVIEQMRWDDGAQGMVTFPYEEGSDDSIVNVRKETWIDDQGNADWNWRYRAENYGQATLQVTYLDADGNEQSYTFTIWVSADRYQVNLWTEDGSDRALPSAMVTLHAWAWHDADHGYDSNEDRYEYAWDLQGNAGIATIDPTGQDSAIVTFHDCWENIWQDVHPRVRVYLLDENGIRIKDESTGEDMIVAERSMNLFVCDDYHELWPFTINDLPLDEPLTITPEIRHYQEGVAGGYTVIPDVSFRFDQVDESRLIVSDNQDGSFTIIRRDAEDTGFQIIGSWVGDNGDHLDKPRWYHLDRLDYPLWFEQGDHMRVYSDGTATLTAVSDDLGALLAHGMTIDWAVGVSDDHGNFLYETHEGFSIDGETITLDGATLLADQQIREHGGVNVRARLMSGDAELSDTWCWVELREPRMDYDFEGDRDMVPGWGKDGDWRVDRWYRVDIDTAAYPDDQERPDSYEVTDVTSSDANVVKVWKETWKDDQGNDDWNWRYQALSYGEADITVTYRDIDGSTKNYSFHVRVQNIVYRLDRWFDSGSDTCLPGQSLTVNVQAIQDRENGSGIIEGFHYSWALLEEADWQVASLQADGQKATVTFQNAPEGERDYRRSAKVRVTATKGDLTLEEDIWFNCEQRYPELALVDGEGNAISLDSNLAVGASVTVTPKIYYHGADPEEQDITSLTWHFDGNFVEIKDAGGNVVSDGNEIQATGINAPYTITRKGEWRSSINLEAGWYDPDFEWDSGNRHEHLDWYFSALGASMYDVWLASDPHATAYMDDEWGNPHPVVYDDNELTLTLMADSLGIDDYNVAWTVGDSYDWDNDVWNDHATLLDSGYTADGDSITLDGSALPSWNGYIVRAQITRGSETIYTVAEWIERKESCTAKGMDHVWAEKEVFKQPTTQEPGAKSEFCRDCKEVRIVEVPKLRISIAPATVTVAKATYTSKALKPVVTVKLSGETLKKGTDYTVAYKNNVNVGTNKSVPTVTITGKGTYSGSKSVKFTIAKANNTLKVKPVKKTQTAAAGTKTAIAAKKAFKVAKNVSKGKVTYNKASGDKKITVSKAGAITINKGLKKGKYKVEVKVTSAATKNYNAATKTITLTIKVK